MIEVSKKFEADIFFAIPSSVPSTDFETSGGELDWPEMKKLLEDPHVICLGEVMNYPDIIHNPEGKTNRILRHLRQRDPRFIIEGHCPKLEDLDLNRFIYAGIDSDHTQQTASGMSERMKRGMFVEIQEKSINRENIDFLTNKDGLFCFVTDDRMADSFWRRGHLNALLSKAVELGMPPKTALFAATASPAARMKLSDRGSIAPGKVADFFLTKDLSSFQPVKVYKNGREAHLAGQEDAPAQSFPSYFYHSVHLPAISLDDFRIAAPQKSGVVPCRIIKITEGTTFTGMLIASLPVRECELLWEESPYAFIGVFERYGKNGNKAQGLLTGPALTRGALATTYAHDHHNLLVLGRSKEDLLLAARTVMERQGGICAVVAGKILSYLSLPVGGILSDKGFDAVGQEVEELLQAMFSLGYRTGIMSFCTPALPVSPELKITDRGLIDVNGGRIVSLFV
ncbi:adenine deaminase [Acididesulfobacillus acetoxydans]|uniref:Adenine deaminase n=1 Tax=Acididesulfobacillus acetoxydans TaxID=1561005 RepID=A0A8S0WFD3_9FIRM|nr:adenine deaminase C-terminal domain-containing protein [Acididesulfobacillus acetoxydans]CAA7600932.1 adenine deaminase [Acididesulfobacillus acetoxydans]CEJ08911.1 Adenine deaminase 2 [Acididesulfobacillus acetoxydans]